MSVLQFVLAGDLDENKTQRLQNPQALFQERCHPVTMIVRQDKKETRIGRKNSRMPPDYALESAVSNRMISRNHVTIERLSKGNYMLYDHSLNGTYVNYCRVIGGTILKNDDIVCFGHINGANIKPGESVTPFSTDLKYRVEIMARAGGGGAASGDRAGTRCEQFSDSSDNDSAPKGHSSRKRVKPTKPATSDQSDRSSDDSSNASNNNKNNNYVHRKKAPPSSGSSSEDDRRKQPQQPMYKKSSTDKPKKRFSDSVRSRPKSVLEMGGGGGGPPLAPPPPPSSKTNYSKTKGGPSESKRGRGEDDRRLKERSKAAVAVVTQSGHKLVQGHHHHQKTTTTTSGGGSSSHVTGNNHGHTKQSSASSLVSSSSHKRHHNNSNYDYEECSAQPCLRPDGDNLIDWIMCDKCNQWFHQFCVGLDEPLEDDESYYCPRCATAASGAGHHS